MSPKKRRRHYTGDDIDVSYDIKRCIHAAECARGLPAVFNIEQRPWVQPNQAPADAVAEVILRCPSGALQFERQDGGPEETPPTENTITLDADGPLYLRGNIEIVDKSGKVLFSDTRMALCRCGASDNKPFCDGQHAQINFQAPAVLGDVQLKEKDTPSDSPSLQIRPRLNGPLVVSGRVRLQANAGEDGESLELQTRTALCRCGASGNKPFCDGSHKNTDFQADIGVRLD